MQWMLAAVAATGLTGNAMAQPAVTASPPPDIMTSYDHMAAPNLTAHDFGVRVANLRAFLRLCQASTRITPAASRLLSRTLAELPERLPDPRWRDVALGVALATEYSLAGLDASTRCQNLARNIGAYALDELAR